MEREYETAQVRYRRPILPGGSALMTDQILMIRTTWSASGKALPDIPGVSLTGRQIIRDSMNRERQGLFAIPAGNAFAGAANSRNFLG